MLLELFYYIIIIYLIYKGILFVARVYRTINKKENIDPISPKSKFKDVEEAHYTEIKDDKDKDSN
jgi:hypothetical protein